MPQEASTREGLDHSTGYPAAVLQVPGRPFLILIYPLFCETGKRVSFFLAIFLCGHDENKRSALKILRDDTKRGSNALVSTAVTVLSAPKDELWSSLICGCAPQD